MEETKPKTFVFVLMPFSEEFRDIYELGIKAACTEAGAYCERVDEQKFDENILERIYNQIAKADVLVAEMTGRNANVFYETGYAHALNKRVILLTQKADDIPFDLKLYTHIVYEGKITTLRALLGTMIRWCIENPKQSLSNVDANLQFSIDGISLDEKPAITWEYPIELTIVVHNPTSKLIDADSLSLSIISSEAVDFWDSARRPVITPRSSFKLPDGRHMYNLHPNFKLFPGGWDSFNLTIVVGSAPMKTPHEIILRCYTELGPKDNIFLIKPLANN